MICPLWSVCKVIVALFCAKSDNEVERNMLLINNFVFIVFSVIKYLVLESYCCFFDGQTSFIAFDVGVESAYIFGCR